MAFPQSETVTSSTTTGPVLLVINADTGRQSLPPSDRSKERLADYTALRLALGATVLDWQSVKAVTWARWVSSVLGSGVALALLALTQRARYAIFYCDSENNGLVLALLFKLTRTRRQLVMIGHWITPSKKAFLFRWLRVYTHIDRIFLHSSVQYDLAQRELRIPQEKLKLLPYQVDALFWNAENANLRPEEPAYICTAGLEFRDYATLIEAVRGIAVEVKIGAASHWSKRTDALDKATLPSNVDIRSYNYTELRDLYAGCQFVVVPLQDVNFQAGITVILEAMAMGKAVVVSRSEGQGDTIVDRRSTTRSMPPRTAKGNLTSFLGEIETNPTGYYVSVGNADELRRAIQHLLAHPETAAEMGRSGRQLVESALRVEDFAARIAQVIAELDAETALQGGRDHAA